MFDKWESCHIYQGKLNLKVFEVLVMVQNPFAILMMGFCNLLAVVPVLHPLSCA